MVMKDYIINKYNKPRNLVIFTYYNYNKIE